ncbi:MAG TPA: hypothetical protein VKA21_03900 [Candidatus Binatia bacterium]|nr:hypothetical protein [Candidatus Binatia bacterium]
MTPRRLAPGLLLVCLIAGPVLAGSFVTFESGQVRPLALSPDGNRLFAVNTPDGRLEIFAVDAGGITHTDSVPVGMEPVAVAARTDDEVWVVNHLSDSVSVVDVSATPPRVVRTLLVGDEPRDIVFAGNRAFITAAHRGQNVPFDPQLTSAGVGRADVWVFDALALGAGLGGSPVDVVTVFGDTPRALAVSPSGGTVYAAVFHSGNRTTAINEGTVCNGGAGGSTCDVGGFTMPGGLPAPNDNVEHVAQPQTGLIVKYNPGTMHWEDRLGRNWNNAVRFDLPDIDVFGINTTSLAITQSFTGVGTILFNMVTNPVSGTLYVSNTEARNEVRFEGPGTYAATVSGVPPGPKTVRGHLHESRISVLASGIATPRFLNKHIDYSVVPSLPGVKEASLATPVGMAVTADGTTLYVAAFGSSAVGVFSTVALENDTFTPSAASHIGVSGGGPSGLVLDEPRDRLYVFTRFDNAISVVDTSTNAELDHVPVFNPEPASVVDGRPILYDALATSSNGEASCAACHVFGDFDSLAWDLGNPDDVVLNDPNQRRVGNVFSISFDDFHPLKGPMTTQSLRGMANNGPMHWRGDRTGGNDPGGDFLDEDAAFKKFIVAFDGLLGRGAPITDLEMQAFTDFILQVTYPPNPVRPLDNVLTPNQAAGHDFFMNSFPSDVFEACNGCHVLDPANGHFGTDGFSSFEFEPQLFKIPHLRNLYQKVGMFGMPAVTFINPGDNGHKGDQVRGFGFLHDGSIDTVFRFHNGAVFNRDNPGGFPIDNDGGFANGTAGDPQRRQVEQFMLAFDTNLAPIVGQQITYGSATAGVAGARVDLLEARADAGECDLIVKGTLAGEQRGWLRVVGGSFQSDRHSELGFSDGDLRTQALAAGQELTFTCVPPGSGVRAGVDRDEDGFYDRTEVDEATDPADAGSHPAGPIPTTTTVTTTSTTTTTTYPFTTIQATMLQLRDDTGPPANPRRRRFSFRSSTKDDVGPGFHYIVIPTGGTIGDPRVNGATLIVYNAAVLTSDVVTIPLPREKWRAKGGVEPFVRMFRYDDPDPSAPVRSVSLKSDSLKIKGGGIAWGYTLDEPAQERIGVRLVLGGGSRWCAAAPARTSGSPPSTASNDRVDKFVGARKTPAPAVCPPTP